LPEAAARVGGHQEFGAGLQLPGAREALGQLQEDPLDVREGPLLAELIINPAVGDAAVAGVEAEDGVEDLPGGPVLEVVGPQPVDDRVAQLGVLIEYAQDPAFRNGIAQPTSLGGPGLSDGDNFSTHQGRAP